MNFTLVFLTADDDALGIKLYLICSSKSYDKKLENVAALVIDICIDFNPYVVIELHCALLNEVESIFFKLVPEVRKQTF